MKDLFDNFYQHEYKTKAKTKMTDDWNERVTKALVDWFEMKMNEALKLADKKANMFNLADFASLIVREAPGVEAYFMKAGADVFLQDEVEIIVGWETEEEVQERLNKSFSELNADRY